MKVRKSLNFDTGSAWIDMPRLFVILLVLLLALLVLVPLLERLSRRGGADPPAVPSLARWILPLLMVLAVLQLLAYWFA